MSRRSSTGHPPGTPLDFAPIPVPGPPPDRSLSEAGKRPAAATTEAEAETGQDIAFAPVGPRTRPGVGSNNWAVSGRLTANGFPSCATTCTSSCRSRRSGMSCNSPPRASTSAASPSGGALRHRRVQRGRRLGIHQRDRRRLDWYGITFKDGARAEYLYGGEWRKTSVREERIKVRARRRSSTGSSTPITARSCAGRRSRRSPT